MPHHNAPASRPTGSKLMMAAALALLLLQALVFFIQGRNFLHSEQQQEHAGLTLLRCRELLADLQDAETGQRGFLLTGAEEYLEPYLRASKDMDDHLRRTRLLLQDDAVLAAQFDRLQTVTDQKMIELADTVRLRRAGNEAAALARMRDGSGRAYMVEARTLLDSMMLRVRSGRSATGQELSEQVRTAGAILLSILATVAVMAALAMQQLLRALRRNEELSRRLDFEATHDELTGLPNRRLLYSRMLRLTEPSQLAAAPFAVLFLGLDQLKQINDNQGHAGGDQVLRAAAAAIVAAAPDAALVARVGGDEFALLLTGDISHATLKLQAGRLLQLLAAPLLADLPDSATGASIGLALYPEHGRTPDRLLHAADTAMYLSRRSGPGRYRFAAAPADAAANPAPPAPELTPTTTP